MTRFKRVLVAGLALGAAGLLWAGWVHASTWFLDSAEEFTIGRVQAILFPPETLTVSHFRETRKWDPIGAWPVSWRYGTIERVNTEITDKSGYVFGATVSLQRWRVTNPPGSGSCYFGTFVGQADWSKDTSEFSAGSDWYTSYRDLPRMDFGAEAAVPTYTFTGYTSRITAVAHDVGGTTTSKMGCYRIFWTLP